MKRRGHADPVTPEVREFVLRRDGMCVAVKLGFRHECRDQWGNLHYSFSTASLQLDHVPGDYGRMGRREKSTPDHLVSLCAFAHLQGWATSHRAELRAYLASFREEREAA